MTSARTPLRPTIIAPSPMRTNWRTADAAAEHDIVADLTWPPSTTLLAKMTLLPTLQSCADMRADHEEAAVADLR